MSITTFLFLTAAVCIMQVIENIKLLRQNGEELALDRAFSLIEFFWFFVCAYVLAFEEVRNLEVYVCVSYILYNVFGWVLAAREYSRAHKAGEEAIVIPLWYFKVCVGWALFGSGFAIFVAKGAY